MAGHIVSWPYVAMYRNAWQRMVTETETETMPLTASQKNKRYRARLKAKRLAAGETVCETRETPSKAGQGAPMPLAWIDGSPIPAPLTEREALGILAKNATCEDVHEATVAAKGVLSHIVATKRIELEKARAAGIQRAPAVPVDFCSNVGADDEESRQ